MIRFLKDNNGAAAIEYGLIAALISVVIIAALTIVGGAVNNTYSSIGSSLGAASL